MKITYLAYKEQADGTRALSVITAEDWKEIQERNKALPPAERRYFLSDAIKEGGEIDVMLIEMDQAQYRRENSQKHNAAKKARDWQRHPPCSLDQLLHMKDGDALLRIEQIRGSTPETDAIDSAVTLELLREKLAAWEPWACDMLDCYISGNHIHCTAMLAEKYGVSVQSIRSYKRSFKDFVKNFLV